MKEESKPRLCPDGGTCHHQCQKGCFRVKACAPLSGVYPDDWWPASVQDLPETEYKSGTPIEETLVRSD
jgi:hypothetical protein